MKKLFIYVLLTGILLFIACGLEDPVQPKITTITQNQLVLTKMIAIGNSLTAGVQSGGIVEDFQINSYPNLVAQQMGQGETFQQPIVASPGVSEVDPVSGEAYGPLKFVSGQIVQGDPVPGGALGIPALATNLLLPRPYDNLGLPGADVGEILSATSGGSGLWDLVLRNPNFGYTTAIDQAKLLNPTLVFLWAGNNDVLGAALDGGDPSKITSVNDFQTSYTQLMTEIGEIRGGNLGIIMANIPNVTDIPYVNLLDDKIYKDFMLPGVPGPISLPVLFDQTFQPIDFDTSAQELYIPLLTSENLLTTGSPVTHVLLPFLSEYQASGLGVPDSAALVPLLIASGVDPMVAPIQAGLLQQAMQAGGLITSGDSIPGTLTLTAAETQTIAQAVEGFNQVISAIAGSTTPAIPVVDMNAILNTLNTSGYDGYTGEFVFFDPQNAAFSLDGVHPNNGGYAIIANEFLKVLNQFPDITLPLLNTADYKGQYTAMPPLGITVKAAMQAKAMFVE